MTEDKIFEISENTLKLPDNFIYDFFINLYLKNTTYNDIDNNLLFNLIDSYLTEKHLNLREIIIKKSLKRVTSCLNLFDL